MADKEDNPLSDLVPTVSDVAGEVVAFKKNWVKWAAWKTLSTYPRKLMVTGMITLPLGMGGAPTISQEVARKPDEHLSSKPQPSTVIDEGASAYVVSTTGTSESIVKMKRF